MTEEDDDDDIYADLTTLNIINAEPKVDEEKVKLQSLLEEKEQELNQIKESRNALEKEKKTLEENISSLFKTAVNELKKKDAVIAELIRQKDAIVFRRGKRHNLDDTNRDVLNSGKQRPIENNVVLSGSTGLKSGVEPPYNQKTSKCESASANVKLVNKEGSYCNSSYIKSSTKDSREVPGGNSERRSGSSDSNYKEKYTSHSKDSSRYNPHSSSRWRNGENVSGHRHSSEEDWKRKRYDAPERYHPRPHVRSPSPKRSRREGSRERDNVWRRRRTSYNRPPPSDSVRVAAQVKSKYSKADRERSLSRTPVKKLRSPDMVDSLLQDQFIVLSELDCTEGQEDPKEVDGDVKKTSGSGDENDDKESFPLCKSPRVMSNEKDVRVPSNEFTGVNSSGDSSDVMKPESKTSCGPSLDSVSNNIQIDSNTTKAKSKNCVILNSAIKELNQCSLGGDMSGGEGKEVTGMKVDERNSSAKEKKNPRENSSVKKKKRRTKSPSVTDVEKGQGLSKNNVSTSPVPSVACQIQTPPSNHANQGTKAFTPSPAFRTPPLKSSPSFEDPAVVKDHKFSYVVFNEQCNFQRPNRKRSIRISGGSVGSSCESSPNAVDQRILTTVNRSASGEEALEESAKQALASDKKNHSNKKSDSGSVMRATRSDAEYITDNSKNYKKTLSVEGSQNKPENLRTIRNADESCVKKKKVLKGETEANISSTKEKEKKVPSASFDISSSGSGCKLSGEGRTKVSEKVDKAHTRYNDLKANVEKKISDVTPESDKNSGLLGKEVRKPSSDKCADETPKVEGGGRDSKPKPERRIVVTNFKRKVAANFQDNTTKVLTQVRSNTNARFKS